eukprot:TRINITY_DN4339_c0_g1_i1.p1 TRINITY_DN4339_c0_g1~~TRINITY_DN4339_c0_g1_i1.p1  ORF type:complete len:255 (-),score=47.72 TRINITY_DN4339_c0_g1_i1:244-1008(-)
MAQCGSRLDLTRSSIHHFSSLSANGLIAGPYYSDKSECRGRAWSARFLSKRRVYNIRCNFQDAKGLILSEEVKMFPPKQASLLVSSTAAGKTVDGLAWQLLDVRPPWETEKAAVKGSLSVPLFIEDDDSSPVGLIKRQIQFGFGGWWLGMRLTKENPEFVKQVYALVASRDTPLLVACQDGLRSLVAVSKLHEDGFTRVAWLAGGFLSASDTDFVVEGESKLRLAGAGGVQGLLFKIAAAAADAAGGKKAAASE